MKQWLQFMAALVGWALVGAALLNVADPVAVGLVWLVGFVWLTGWMLSGPKDADALTGYWLATLGGLAVLGVGFYAIAAFV